MSYLLSSLSYSIFSLPACIAGKQVSRVYNTRKSFKNVADLQVYDSKLRKQLNSKKNKKQLALIRAFGAILVANFIVWTPLTIIYAAVLLIVDRNEVPLGIITVILLHAVLHPIIEGCFIPESKMIFIKVLCVSHCGKLIRKRRSNGAVLRGQESRPATPTSYRMQ